MEGVEHFDSRTVTLILVSSPFLIPSKPKIKQQCTADFYFLLSQLSTYVRIMKISLQFLLSSWSPRIVLLSHDSQHGRLVGSSDGDDSGYLFIYWGKSGISSKSYRRVMSLTLVTVANLLLFVASIVVIVTHQSKSSELNYLLKQTSFYSR